MDEELRCIGCGAILQSQDENEAGFLPASALNKALEGESQEVYCKRCFRLRHYSEIMPVELNNDDFLRLLNSLGDKKALIVNVVDLFDFNNSLIPSLKRFVGKNDFILVGNKVDLFPLNSKESKIKDWMRQEANRMGLYPKDIFLISAAKKRNLQDLIAYLDRASQNQDVYFVGTTNVGKSTLINSIIDLMGDVKDLITTSRFPGTTLDQIKIPLDSGHYLVDTPGIMTDKQLASYLNSKDLDLIAPKKPLKPATYQLNSGQTLFLGGLGRIDFVSGEKTSFTVYTARGLYVHRTKTENADEFYEKHVGDLLTPPHGDENLPAMKGQTYHPTTKSDLLFGGIGFITVPAGVVVKTYLPGGIGQGIRRALI
ncbi:ribosome biogenesis GTPase YqeH [Lactobacillus mulieris]|uniref:ribosome biogenesis GTPase YqeH n=1 Tax=Lactobacillus mulieris TaxID=2508708 RepID=UPI001F022B67|nr:ribosome biogenesis GTPase YqeH [Lactobacillus mulieris]MCF1783412.1 ribosome biogenesis GTPase YqeH [Lactobacillus mulieris]MCW8104056.1 ribosome biogenesis GTPase YqeH [Lactobacillus mulieris]